MPDALRYFLMEDGRRAGPHSLAVLRQKAEIRTLTVESLLAPENEPDAWRPLSAVPGLSDELLPTRVRHTLRSHHSGEMVNTPSLAPTPSVEDLLRGNLARQREAEGELLPLQPPRPNKRRRDYLILAALINGLVLVNLALGRPWYDPFLLGFFVMGNISLAWVLYGVMDRY